MKNTSNSVKTPAIAAVLAAGLVLAPAAQADTGVGKVIAAQGNIALHLIKAEIRESVQSWKPTLAEIRKPSPSPVKSAAGEMTQTADGLVASGTARCAP